MIAWMKVPTQPCTDSVVPYPTSMRRGYIVLGWDEVDMTMSYYSIMYSLRVHFSAMEILGDFQLSLLRGSVA